MSILLDGSTSVRNINLLAVPNSDQVMIHFWINAADPLNGAQQYIYDQSSASRSYVRIDGTGGTLGRVFVNIKDSTQTTVINMGAGLALQPSNGWIAFDFVLDQTRGFAKIYRNLVQVGSATPGNANPITHIASAADLYQRGDNALPLLNGTMVDQFYYSNAIPSTYTDDNGNLTAEYIKQFYELDSNADTFRRKASLSTTGTPIMLFENDFTNAGQNNGSEGNGTVFGTPQDTTDKTYILP